MDHSLERQKVGIYLAVETFHRSRGVKVSRFHASKNDASRGPMYEWRFEKLTSEVEFIRLRTFVIFCYRLSSCFATKELHFGPRMGDAINRSTLPQRRDK